MEDASASRVLLHPSVPGLSRLLSQRLCIKASKPLQNSAGVAQLNLRSGGVGQPDQIWKLRENRPRSDGLRLVHDGSCETHQRRGHFHFVHGLFHGSFQHLFMTKFSSKITERAKSGCMRGAARQCGHPRCLQGWKLFVRDCAVMLWTPVAVATVQAHRFQQGTLPRAPRQRAAY